MSMRDDEVNMAARRIAQGADPNTLEDSGAAFDAAVFYRAAELHAEALEKSAAVACFRNGDAVSRDQMSPDDLNVVKAVRLSAEITFNKSFD